MKKISILLVFVMLMSLVSVTSFASEDTAKADTLAKITELKGDASIIKESTQKTIKAFKKMKLSEGDTVVTTKDAQLRMLLENKILVIVEGNSEVVVRKNSKNKVTKGYERLLELKTGSLVVVADKKLQENEKLEVKTQTMVAGVRGTSFGIVSKPDHYYIEVYEGVVQLTPNEEYATINPAIRGLKPILIKKQRTKLIKFSNFVSDYYAEPKRTQEPLIYPNILLRFKEDIHYYGRYGVDREQDVAMTPQVPPLMEERMKDELGLNFTFEKAYGFNKKGDSIATGGGGGGGGSHPSAPVALDVSVEPIPNGIYKNPVSINGNPYQVEVKVKNGKIISVDVPGLAPVPNEIGLAKAQIIETNSVDAQLQQSADPGVKALAEAVKNALKKDAEPELALTGLQQGHEWFGQARGNEHYDLSSNVGPMEVQIAVDAASHITSITHQKFGDNSALLPASSNTGLAVNNTYKPIRDAVVAKQGTDFVKKAVLYGGSAPGLSAADKITAANIYRDVVGSASGDEAKKRQKSAIGYISAIENAIERAKAGQIVIGGRNLKSLTLDSDTFTHDDDKAHYKEAKDLSHVSFIANYTTGASDQKTITDLVAAGIVVQGENSDYNAGNKQLTYNKNLSDYSVTSKYELKLSHANGFEYNVPIPVVRGIDDVAVNRIEAKELKIGKTGQNYTLPVMKNGNGGIAGHYLFRGKPSFMQSGNFDALKIMGVDNSEFDLTKGYNKQNNRVQLKLVTLPASTNLAFELKKDAAVTFKMLNNPLPSEHKYKVSAIRDDPPYQSFFDVDLLAEFKQASVLNTAGRIQIKRGTKLLDTTTIWSSGGLAPVPFNMDIKIEGDQGDIKSSENMSTAEKFKLWGLYTQYSDAVVPSDATLGDADIPLKIAVYTPNGVEYVQVGTIPVTIIN